MSLSGFLEVLYSIQSVRGSIVHNKIGPRFKEEEMVNLIQKGFVKFFHSQYLTAVNA